MEVTCNYPGCGRPAVWEWPVGRPPDRGHACDDHVAELAAGATPLRALDVPPTREG